ncbi:hypothetical protein WME90_04530 [Sorangium sp. So ce375]|uniref:hypothetical protein n=1 Tax=Sorangium sp. So ce375 TaxID=3133306 RepID=UPI003F5BB102
MKIDSSTGRLELESGLVLSPALSRSQFLASPAGVASTVSVRNEPWCSFRFEAAAENVVLAVFFKAEVLGSVHLAVIDPRFGAGWDDWSEEKETQRKEANDRWLLAHGLTPGEKYAWGSVWSGFDPKGGFSSVVIRYAEEG